MHRFPHPQNARSSTIAGEDRGTAGSRSGAQIGMSFGSRISVRGCCTTVHVELSFLHCSLMKGHIERRSEQHLPTRSPRRPRIYPFMSALPRRFFLPTTTALLAPRQALPMEGKPAACTKSLAARQASTMHACTRLKRAPLSSVPLQAREGQSGHRQVPRVDLSSSVRLLSAIDIHQFYPPTPVPSDRYIHSHSD